MDYLRSFVYLIGNYAFTLYCGLTHYLIPPSRVHNKTAHAISRVAWAAKIYYDVFCRYGGDEFLLFVANASHEQARIIAEKLRKHIDIHRFDGVENVTVSIGIAIRQKNESIGSLVARADKSLYRAKNEGRNRVIVEDEETQTEEG